MNDSMKTTEISTAINEGKYESALRIVNDEVEGLILQGSTETLSALFNCASDVISNVATAHYAAYTNIFATVIEKEVQRQAKEHESEDKAYEVIMLTINNAISQLRDISDERQYEAMKMLIDTAKNAYEVKMNKSSSKPSLLTLLSNWINKK